MRRGRHASYLEPYRRAVEEHGAGFAATLWNSAEAQQLRFAIMLDMTDFQGAAIVDAGCGSGDFADMLVGQGVAFSRYFGIDGIEAQIHAARRRQLPGCTFEVGDFVHEPALLAREGPPDLICFSGSLNTMEERTARGIVERAFAMARDGVIFNFLSDRADASYLRQALHPARRFNTLRMLDLAFNLSPRVRFRQDYLDGHDATILIEKMGESAEG